MRRIGCKVTCTSTRVGIYTGRYLDVFASSVVSVVSGTGRDAYLSYLPSVTRTRMYVGGCGCGCGWQTTQSLPAAAAAVADAADFWRRRRTFIGRSALQCAMCIYRCGEGGDLAASAVSTFNVLLPPSPSNLDTKDARHKRCCCCFHLPRATATALWACEGVMAVEDVCSDGSPIFPM